MSCKYRYEQLATWLVYKDQCSRLGDLGSHIQTCSECSEKVLILEGSEQNIRLALAAEPPVDLWVAVDAHLQQQIETPRRPQAIKRTLAYGLFTFLLALIVIMQFRPGQKFPLDPDIPNYVSNHRSLPEAAASSKLTLDAVKSFERHNDIIVHIPSNLPSGWTLVKLDRFVCRRGSPVAQSIYQKGTQRISIFQKPLTRGKGMGQGRGKGKLPQSGQCRYAGLDMAYASNTHHRFVAVGDLPLGSLNKLVQNLVNQK